MKLIFVVLIVFLVLMGSEAWWRHRKHKQAEASRKLVHITVGSFVAFWPFFLSWDQIRLLSLAFLVVVFVSKELHIFRVIHSVQRPTWGELYFAIAVGGITYVTHDKWVYMAALLLMSLADGLAAVIGVRYGKKQRYKVFGQTKSIAGTVTFFITALLILFFYNRHTVVDDSGMTLPAIALLATVIENFAVQGLDNLFVPFIASCLLVMAR